MKIRIIQTMKTEVNMRIQERQKRTKMRKIYKGKNKTEMQGNDRDEVERPSHCYRNQLDFKFVYLFTVVLVAYRERFLK